MRPPRRPPPGAGAALVLVLAMALAGCATSLPQASSGDWPMIPSIRATPPVPVAAARDAQPSGSSEEEVPSEGLVTLPVPPETSPLAELANLFDRIRLGYQLADVVNPMVDRELRYFVNNPDFLDRTFERGERYLYYVVRELEARHMPLELAMLPVIESAYNPYAYSRARAAGIWQFITPTATHYQVRVNWWQDGRRDVVDSTRAALDYLSELHTIFGGDWLLAIAAYNCGETAVQRAVAKARAARRPTDFFHLKLPRETRAYVPRLLAMARIVADPDSYGLEFASIANQPFFAQVQVGSQIDLRVAASLLDVGEGELHALNPAFNRWATDPDGPYHVLVPFAAAPEFARTVAALSREQKMPIERYRLTEGDSLAKLGRERDIPFETIRQLNGAATVDFKVGDEVLLPASKIAPLRAGLIIEGETPLPGHRRRNYVVRRGDTLASIARHNHVPIEELARLNGLAPHAHLTAGNRLVVEVRERHARRRHKGTPATSASDAASRKVSQLFGRGDARPATSSRYSVSVADVETRNRPLTAERMAGEGLVLYVPVEQRHGG